MRSKDWETRPLEDKCESIQEINRRSIDASTLKKKQSVRKQALPTSLVEMIKERRKKRVYLDLIASETSKRVDIRAGEK